MKLTVSVGMGVYPVDSATAAILSDKLMSLDSGTEVEEVLTQLENPDLNLYKILSGAYAGSHFVQTKKDCQRTIKR